MLNSADIVKPKVSRLSTSEHGYAICINGIPFRFDQENVFASLSELEPATSKK